MEVKMSTKKIMLSIIDEFDLILREFLSVLISNEENTNPIKLLDLLLDKDAELKSLLPKVNEQMKMQRFMDYLKSEIEKRDKMILSCQLHLRKSEIILNTAIYYSRKKLNVISTAVANPVDPEEIIKYGHRITTGHGVVAPHNWDAGDKRRPFPTEENIRNGYLGHVDNVSGEFVSSLVDYAGANQESRLNVLFGLTQSREGVAPSPLQSPRINTQQNISATAAVATGGRMMHESPVGHASGVSSAAAVAAANAAANASLAQLPPGVNVVSSPASGGGGAGVSRPMAIGGGGGSGAQSAFGQHAAVAAAMSANVTPTATDHRIIASRMQQQQQDEVEVMTDSCSSSSSDGF